MLKLMTLIALEVSYHQSTGALQCSREAFADWFFDGWNRDHFYGWTEVVNAYVQKIA